MAASSDDEGLHAWTTSRGSWRSPKLGPAGEGNDVSLSRAQNKTPSLSGIPCTGWAAHITSSPPTYAIQ